MSMKKLIAVLLLIVMAVTLTACGKRPPLKPPPRPRPKNPQRLRNPLRPPLPPTIIP